MDKKLRLSVEGTIRFLAVFAVIIWLWNFFRSYLLFLMILLMIAGVILSAFSLWSACGKIEVQTILPYQRVGKNTELTCEIRAANPLRFVGFAVDVTCRFGNFFTGSLEERQERLWAAPRKGGVLLFLLNSRYAGRIRVSVEAYKVYDPLHLFYLAYRVLEGAESLVWPAFSDGEDVEGLYACIEGFPKEDESRKRGMDYQPDYEVREYIEGDELKSIHWKLSAKQGEIMVRERLAAGREKVNVLLPLSEEKEENDALAASLYGLCRLLLSGEYPIQLYWQGASRELCSRFIMEQGELENALGEILSMNGRRAAGAAVELMAIEHPAEPYILVRTGAYRGVYVTS